MKHYITNVKTEKLQEEDKSKLITVEELETFRRNMIARMHRTKARINQIKNRNNP